MWLNYHHWQEKVCCNLFFGYLIWKRIYKYNGISQVWTPIIILTFSK